MALSQWRLKFSRFHCAHVTHCISGSFVSHLPVLGFTRQIPYHCEWLNLSIYFSVTSGLCPKSVRFFPASARAQRLIHTSSFQMGPPPPRKPVAKDRFSALFASLKTQTYHDPSTRGPGSHTYLTSASRERSFLLKIIL